MITFVGAKIMGQRMKKTYLLDQDLIDRLKETTGAKTETEAVNTAIEEFLFRKKVLLWHLEHAGKFHIENIDA